MWTGTAPTPPTSRTRPRSTTTPKRPAIYNAEQIETERMVENADVVEGCRAVGFTTVTPAVSMLGVVEGLLVDRAFIAERKDSAAELAAMTDLGRVAPRHMVANALAAAALVRAYGVDAGSRPTGLPNYLPGDHRIQPVARQQRCPVDQRLEGHQPARRRRSAVGIPATWCGSPAACPRASTMTTWSGTTRTGSRPWCSSVRTPRRWQAPSSDTHRMSPLSRPAKGDTEGGADCRTAGADAEPFAAFRRDRDGPGRRDGGAAGRLRRYGADGPGGCFHGSVLFLRSPWRRLHRSRPRACGRAGTRPARSNNGQHAHRRSPRQARTAGTASSTGRI